MLPRKVICGDMPTNIFALRVRTFKTYTEDHEDDNNKQIIYRKTILIVPQTKTLWHESEDDLLENDSNNKMKTAFA